MELLAGMKIGSYVLCERVGTPNLGEVWRAEGRGGAVAVKSVSTRHAGDPWMEARFQAECRVHQSLHHAGIVPVVECVAEAGRRYLVLHYVSGGTLEDRLFRGPLEASEAVAIAVQVLDALDHAHQQGVVHRDVKPANILLEGDRAYLTDFGIAAGLPLGDVRAADTSGTVAYMSPEQISLRRVVDQRSDEYGFGCVLYEMLTGRPPFPLEKGDGCSDDRIRMMHITEKPIPPSEINPAVDRNLEAIVLQALEKDPDHRFGGCGSFALALREWRPAGHSHWQAAILTVVAAGLALLALAAG